jgi:hypothetical protein
VNKEQPNSDIGDCTRRTLNRLLYVIHSSNFINVVGPINIVALDVSKPVNVVGPINIVALDVSKPVNVVGPINIVA